MIYEISYQNSKFIRFKFCSGSYMSLGIFKITRSFKKRFASDNIGNFVNS